MSSKLVPDLYESLNFFLSFNEIYWQSNSIFK